MTGTVLETPRPPAPAAQVPERRQRRLSAYLLVPRPGDLSKACVMPLLFVLGAVASGGTDARAVLRAVVVWFALELLVYQARYQWNDVRGFVADQSHPDGAARGRLPGPLSKARPHITASLLVMALRLGLTAALVLLLPGLDLGPVLAAVVVGVFGVAVVYEHLRSRATGRTDAVPSPLCPALVALWVVVGAGYAVRGMTGFALAVDLRERPGLAVAAAVAVWAAGCCFVTSRWALEATPFASFDGDRTVWRAQAGHAREHTLGLVRWLPDHADTADLPPGGGPKQWRAVHGCTSLSAPWSTAAVVAGGASALTGALLTSDVDEGRGAVLVLTGALASVLVVLVGRHRAAGAAAGAVAVVAVLMALGHPSPLLAVLPWLAAAVAHTCFTGYCAADLGHPLRRVQHLLAARR